MKDVLAGAERLLWDNVASTVRPIGVLSFSSMAGDSVDPLTLQPHIDVTVTMTSGIVTSYSSREYFSLKDALGLGEHSRKVLVRNVGAISFDLTHRLLTWKNAPKVTSCTPLLMWENLLSLRLGDTGVAINHLSGDGLAVSQGALVKVDPSGDNRFVVYLPDTQYVIKQVRQYFPGVISTIALDCVQEDTIWIP